MKPTITFHADGRAPRYVTLSTEVRACCDCGEMCVPDPDGRCAWDAYVKRTGWMAPWLH